MDERGFKALLAFYNQTFHGMTMAAALRSLGDGFEFDERLARDMLRNVEKVAIVLRKNPEYQQFYNIWMQVRNWLEAPRDRIAGSDHSSDLYELNALAYITWTKLCNDPAARHYAEEHYTTIVHPDQHPGIGGVNKVWSNANASGTPVTRATLANLAALMAEGKTKR